MQWSNCLSGDIKDTSVPDPNPDPPDPHVFGHPGSGSTSQRYEFGYFCHQAKSSKKNLDSYCFTTASGLFIFGKCCECTNVPSKSNEQKKLIKK
jgi:hypothetical protein